MIVGIFGLPRSGKTTLLCKIAADELKRDRPVFSNFACKGTFQLDFSTLGKLDYSNCTILIDEISLVCDSRDWKKFDSNLRYFFTHHGHYNVDVYYASQWLDDCDVKIRRITEELYYVQRWHFGLSIRFKVEKDVDSSGKGDVVPTYRFKHGRPFRRKPYYPMFDSYERKSLPPAPRIPW